MAYFVSGISIDINVKLCVMFNDIEIIVGVYVICLCNETNINMCLNVLFERLQSSGAGGLGTARDLLDLLRELARGGQDQGLAGLNPIDHTMLCYIICVYTYVYYYNIMSRHVMPLFITAE